MPFQFAEHAAFAASNNIGDLASAYSRAIACDDLTFAHEEDLAGGLAEEIEAVTRSVESVDAAMGAEFAVEAAQLRRVAGVVRRPVSPLHGDLESVQPSPGGGLDGALRRDLEEALLIVDFLGPRVGHVQERLGGIDFVSMAAGLRDGLVAEFHPGSGIFVGFIVGLAENVPSLYRPSLLRGAQALATLTGREEPRKIGRAALEGTPFGDEVRIATKDFPLDDIALEEGLKAAGRQYNTFYRRLSLGRRAPVPVSLWDLLACDDDLAVVTQNAYDWARTGARYGRLGRGGSPLHEVLPEFVIELLIKALKLKNFGVGPVSDHIQRIVENFRTAYFAETTGMAPGVRAWLTSMLGKPQDRVPKRLQIRVFKALKRGRLPAEADMRRFATLYRLGKLRGYHPAQPFRALDHSYPFYQALLAVAEASTGTPYYFRHREDRDALYRVCAEIVDIREQISEDKEGRDRLEAGIRERLEARLRGLERARDLLKMLIRGSRPEVAEAARAEIRAIQAEIPVTSDSEAAAVVLMG